MIPLRSVLSSTFVKLIPDKEPTWVNFHYDGKEIVFVVELIKA